MMPHCQSDAQFELFESPTPAAERPPKLELPFQRSAEIDKARVAKILGVSHATASRMVEAKLFRAYRSPGEKILRIEYDSVVAYCNRLRLEYRISEKMIERPRGRRLRDEDLLPFPLKDTISLKEVCRVLDCDGSAAQRLIEEGALTGYQVQIGRAGCPWRVHLPSLERYVASLHAEAAAAPSPHRSPSRL